MAQAHRRCIKHGLRLALEEISAITVMALLHKRGVEPRMLERFSIARSPALLRGQRADPVRGIGLPFTYREE